MRFHEAKPDTVQPKLVLWGAVNNAVPQSKLLGRRALPVFPWFTPLADWLLVWPIKRFADWFTEWLNDWFVCIVWLIDWFIDWMLQRMANWISVTFAPSCPIIISDSRLHLPALQLILKPLLLQQQPQQPLLHLPIQRRTSSIHAEGKTSYPQRLRSSIKTRTASWMPLTSGKHWIGKGLHDCKRYAYIPACSLVIYQLKLELQVRSIIVQSRLYRNADKF